MNNRAAYLVDDKTLEIRECEMPKVSPDDLLIEVKHVGICGSDLAGYEGLSRKEEYPVILGHECAGEVVGLGENVKGFSIGDKIAIEPGVPCMKCSYCMEGRYNLCDNMNFMACPPWERAAFMTYISHPAMMCFKLPETMSTMEGALVEPLAVGMHAAARAEVTMKDSVLILGSGCIGLTVLLACRARGIRNIYIADIYDKRLEKAKSLGARGTINTANVNIAEYVGEITSEKRFDVVFEAAGNKSTALMTQNVTKKGGRIVIVGNVHGEVPLNLMRIASREIDIIGIFRYRNMYPAAIEAVSSGLIDINSICTDIYRFDEISRGFLDAYERKMEVVKAVIEM